MKPTEYDLVIIGGGPAGLTASIYAARARLNTLILEKSAPGGQILVTDWLENYPGFPEGLSGADLVTKMTDQAKRFGVEIETNQVLSMDVADTNKKLVLSDRTVTCKAVIIATGASPRKLGVAGEEEFYGKGISTCATCDAPFFKNSVVAAIGGGDTAVQESLFLTRFASKVYLIHRRDQLRATRILQERALENDKIEILWDSVLSSVNGSDAGVESITIENVKTGEQSDLAVEGCFVWVGITPNTSFISDAIAVDKGGFIVVNAKMETSVPGVYAAGDVRNTPLRQVATAVGDSAIAAFEAANYIEALEGH
ncbi:MAG: thioredoxin-disulfide reductase [Desulfobacteraceae bacterium]|jgi:thioredoxin reductase (NADPH)|nr:thioredoxin-disulfide reductase [Desulfobacteraceae bacterium]